MAKLLDAKATAYYAKQLEHIKEKVFAIEYDDIMFDKIFTILSDVNPGADTIVRQIMDTAGKAKRMSGYAGDLPRVDITKSEIRNPVILLADAFGYNLDEIEAGAKTGENLQTARAAVARRKIEEEMNEIVWYGDAVTKILGFLNNPDIASGNAPAKWDTLTPAALLLRVTGMLKAVTANSRGKKKPDTLLLDPILREHLFLTPRSDTSDISVGSWLVANVPNLANDEAIKGVPEMLDIVGDGTSISGAAVLDSKVAEVEINTPRDVTFHNEQEVGLEILTPVSARFAGMSYMYPAGAYIEKDV